MDPIVWDPSLETGDELIDSQHRHIVEFTNEVAALDTDDVSVIRDVVDRLMDHIDTHLAVEEDLMTRGGYPPEAAAQHRAAHQMLKDKARAATLEFRSSSNVGREPFVAFLTTWLLDHIDTEDRKLTEFLRDNPLASE